MKSLLPISSLLMLLGSASAFAADLNIPMSFEYLALDGKKSSPAYSTIKAV